MTTQVLDWDSAFAVRDTPSSTSIGSVEIGFSTSAPTGGAAPIQSSTVSNNELGASTEGHLRLAFDADQPGQGLIQTITFDDTGFPVNSGVADVTFTVLDVDRFFFEDQVQIIADDPSGAVLPSSAITLTANPGAGVQVTGDTALGLIDSEADEDQGNVTVAIDGQVSRSDIVFTAGPNFISGTTLQEVGIGPISFTNLVLFDDSDGSDDDQTTPEDRIFRGDGADSSTAEMREDFFGDRIDGGADGVEDDTLDLGGLGPYRLTGIRDDADGNSRSGTVEFLDPATSNIAGSLTFTEIESIICFSPGARILTARGEVPVDALRQGDWVMTRDNGFQPIALRGQRDLTAADLRANAKLRPFLICKGALGDGLPKRYKWVSPNHRMLMTGAGPQMLLGEDEVLVAAKQMTGRDGMQTDAARPTRYLHLMFEAYRSSWQTAAELKVSFPATPPSTPPSHAQRDETFTLFPDLRNRKAQPDYATARPALRRYEARAQSACNR